MQEIPVLLVLVVLVDKVMRETLVKMLMPVEVAAVSEAVVLVDLVEVLQEVIMEEILEVVVIVEVEVVVEVEDKVGIHYLAEVIHFQSLVEMAQIHREMLEVLVLKVMLLQLPQTQDSEVIMPQILQELPLLVDHLLLEFLAIREIQQQEHQEIQVWQETQELVLNLVQQEILELAQILEILELLVLLEILEIPLLL